jgi:hypothetical protein
MVASLNQLMPMRKLFWIAPIALILLAGALAVSFSSSMAASDDLSMDSPDECPTGGCAAGQRLNFKVSFSVTPETAGINTQICVYTANTWADYSDSWISNEGLITSKNYTPGETGNTCTDNADGHQWFLGGYATLDVGTATTDQLEFVLRIDAAAVDDGDVIVKVFHTNGSSDFIESFNESQHIEVSEKSITAYVGQTAIECGNHSPCYINSGDDGANGLGTGLRDAIMAADADSEIKILNDYPIKNNTVLVDKNLTISGSDIDAMITYNGGETCVTEPMLLFTNGGTLKDLTINDGSCINTSRDLIQVDSPTDVSIKHNTLNDGNRAIVILDNDGDVHVAFNQISGHQSYAVLRSSGSSGGKADIVANNFMDNRSWSQVNCNGSGTADHNFWGEGVSATSSALNCGVTDGKQLGAPILLSSGGVGVEAILKQVTGSTTYAFSNKIGVKRTSGSNFYIYIVNHGQGGEDNIPFYEEGAGPIDACSNFYDVFLAESSEARDLTLTLKYDLNASCISTIESSDYCAQSDSSLFPLWWYDPLNNKTNGWERTGGNTTCNMAENSISVEIDDISNPGFTPDLNFTPFVIGLQQSDGVTLSQFTASFDITRTDLKWVTSSEVNIKGFHILRSETSSGGYSRVSPLIDAIGDTFIGGIYSYSDTEISFSRTYYYKLEVIGDNDATVQTYGPVSILTSTNTPTPTMTYTVTLTRTPTSTRTSYATRTSTPYSYRSPTSYYRQNTSTPIGTPTQVRTYGPSSTSTRTLSSTDQAADLTATSEGGSGYPVETQIAYVTSAYPAPDDDLIQITQTPAPENGSNDRDDAGDQNETGGTDEGGSQTGKIIQWGYLLLGAAGGFALLIVVSVILVKTRFS